MTPFLPRAAAITAFLLLGTTGCVSQAEKGLERRSSLKSEGPRHMAPDFTLKDADGKPVTLSEFKGKVVLLNFWATWCGPCKIEIPWFKDFQKTYKDKGFTVLGVAMDDEGWEAVKPYIMAKQVNYPVVVADAQTDTKYGGIESLPTTFVIDKNGKIANVHIGLVSRQDYENDIEQLLR